MLVYRHGAEEVLGDIDATFPVSLNKRQHMLDEHGFENLPEDEALQVAETMLAFYDHSQLLHRVRTMANTYILAVLGGSGVATPCLVQALASCSKRPPMEVRLLGRTASKLSLVASLADKLASKADIALTVRHTTDLARGLDGVDMVLNQIRVGGYEARAIDESFPHTFGIPGEETFGPGGMNNARRTVPVVLELCREVEKAAPRALVLNLTNPSSYIQYAIQRYTSLCCVGVCDSPTWLADSIASVLDVAREELWVGYIGMHHFGWVTEVTHAGRDMMPELLARVDTLPGLQVDVDIVRATRAVPTSYFKYYYHHDRMLAAQEGKPTRAEQLILLQENILTDLARPGLQELPESLQQRGAVWYDKIIVPVLMSYLQDSHDVHILNVGNGTTLPWMPAESIVELPVEVSRDGFTPVKPPRLPRDLRAMLQVNAAFEMLWVEAIVERSYEKALRAMMLNHLVTSLDQARAILDKIWAWKG